ncbi:S41 family peptidase [candidate division KSB1 bacterium]|nr:S41 family peptidase [candidate division KSB1 bacterium]RQW09808.1 MAG: S41 family peptidase [candidate division KSB1 bacterium]
MRKNIKITVAIVLTCLALLGAWSGLLSKSQRDFYAAVGRNIKVFGDVYKQTANNYVEEVDPEKFMRAGINGMLDELDPYSVFLEKEAQDDIEIMTRGKYFGVGMRISAQNGWPTVAEQPFPNSPSEKAGIREGDQIIEIDGQSTKELSLSETAGRLRGEKKGSTVVIKIKRVGVDEPMTFSLIRDEIVVSDIQYTGFVEPGIGLIKLNVFNRGAEKQVANAIETLLDQGAEALILDLRGNPGGLLDVAVEVANNFIPKGEMVVYTKGRNPNSTKEYRTTSNPIFGSLPLVVLVNEYSASASEIVAGAIQDLDRGIIIGERSFGKGLVQTVLPIDRNAEGEVSLKLTTAKYYLPSGRLIQKMDVFKRGRNSVLWSAEEESDDESDDETEDEAEISYEKEEKFFTRNGRQVGGGGGISPDIESSNDHTTRYVGELIRQSMFFNFSLEYAAKHPELANGVEIDENILSDFADFVAAKEFKYEATGMNELEKLEELAKKEEYYDEMVAAFAQMRSKFAVVTEKEKEKSIQDIRYLLKRELVAKLKGNDAAYATSFERDATLKKAVEVLKDVNEYNRLLGSQTTGSEQNNL